MIIKLNNQEWKPCSTTSQAPHDTHGCESPLRCTFLATGFGHSALGLGVTVRQGLRLRSRRAAEVAVELGHLLGGDAHPLQLARRHWIDGLSAARETQSGDAAEIVFVAF
jgi:hypothetical protein